ncbi:MAG: squalene/phytoene synthase family protein [Candidatus Zixiibacteriota bacterium]|nr:MAG: squalene/phytoene synthase family protein [candidate division Zixibacteria bacterium]
MESNGITGLDFAVDSDFDDILTNPILDIAARFWDADRYEAFQVCYRSMRRIDDLVDDRKATGRKITPEEASNYARMISDWLESIKRGENGDQFTEQFLETRVKYSIPLWPWERLCKAMAYDLHHDGYPNFLAFLRYAEGAAISPAAVFMHLCGVSEANGNFRAPTFDIRKAARPLALFSYLVHIIRDFQKDTLANLCYFPLDMLRQHDLNEGDLKAIAADASPTESFRQLVGRIKAIAEYYGGRARETIDTIEPSLPPRYRLSLEIIYSLYSQIFERIDPENGCFSTGELNPTAGQVKERLEVTIRRFSRAGD